MSDGSYAAGAPPTARAHSKQSPHNVITGVSGRGSVCVCVCAQVDDIGEHAANIYSTDLTAPILQPVSMKSIISGLSRAEFGPFCRRIAERNTHV